MLDKKDAPLLDDYVFKRTFTRDDPNGILRDFLESVLKIKLRNVQVLNAEIPKDILDERGSVLDIRAELDNTKIVDIEMHFIELPKFIKKNPEIKTKLDEWLWLIAGREDKIEMSKLDNPEVKKAMKLVDEIMADPKEREIIEARAMAKFNYDTGVAYAKEQGKKESKKEVAKRMKELKMADEQICQILNITTDELKELEYFKTMGMSNQRLTQRQVLILTCTLKKEMYCGVNAKNAVLRQKQQARQKKRLQTGI